MEDIAACILPETGPAPDAVTALSQPDNLPPCTCTTWKGFSGYQHRVLWLVEMVQHYEARLVLERALIRARPGRLGAARRERACRCFERGLIPWLERAVISGFDVPCRDRTSLKSW